MTEPLFADADPAVTASQMRSAFGALMAAGAGSAGTNGASGRSGVRPGPSVSGLSPLRVAATTTPTMFVQVGSGVAYIEPTIADTSYPYILIRSLAGTIAIDAADATNTRYDIVYARVMDPAIAGQPLQAVVAIAKGTPSVTPAEPAIPSNAIPLARIEIRNTDTTITTARITDRRAWAVAAGGVRPYTSSNGEAPIAYSGSMGFDLTSGIRRPTVFDSSSHRGLSYRDETTNRVNEQEWSSNTAGSAGPVVVAASLAFSQVAGVRYRVKASSSLRWDGTASSMAGTFFIRDDNDTSQGRFEPVQMPTGSIAYAVDAMWEYSAASSGTVTFKACLNRSAGSGAAVYGTGWSLLTVDAVRGLPS